MMGALAQMKTHGVQQKHNLGAPRQELLTPLPLVRAEVPQRPGTLNGNMQDMAEEAARPALLLARHPLGQQWTQG